MLAHLTNTYELQQRIFWEGHRQRSTIGAHQGGDEDKMWKPYNLFVDLAPPYSDRVSCLKAMVHNNPDKAHGLVRHGLSVTFDRLHTKESLLFYSKLLIPDATNTFISILWCSVTAGSLVTVLLGFRLSHIYQDHTYLCCLALLLDYLLPAVINTIEKIIGNFGKGRWPD